MSLLIQSPLQRALELAREGQYSQARKLIEGVSEPSSPEARIAFHRLRASIASGLHKSGTAMAEMETALAIAPQDSALLLATASAEMQHGNFQAALTHAQASDPGAAREGLIGDIKEGLHDSEGAVNAYLRAVRLAPGEERYRVALGLERIKYGQFEDAAIELIEARRILTKSARIATLLGIAQYASGYSNEAVSTLNDAIDESPRSHMAESTLARIVLQSSAAPSQRTVQHLCNWDKTICAAVHLRQARESADRLLFVQAKETLRQAPEGNSIRHCELARAYEWEGQWTEARRELQSCVRLDGSPQNHYRLGLLYRRIGETALANQEMAARSQLLKTMSEQTALARAALGGESEAGKH